MPVAAQTEVCPARAYERSPRPLLPPCPCRCRRPDRAPSRCTSRSTARRRQTHATPTHTIPTLASFTLVRPTLAVSIHRTPTQRGARRAGLETSRRRPRPQRCGRRDLPIQRMRAQAYECDRSADRPHRPGQRGRPGQASQPALARGSCRPSAPSRRLCARSRRRGTRLRPERVPAGKRIGPGQVFVLAVHPIDRSGVTAQKRHRSCPCGPAEQAITRAAEGRDGEIPGLRPLARGWASPSGRPSNRLSASQGTRL